MDYVRLNSIIVESIEKVARAAFKNGVDGSKVSVEPDFSELDSTSVSSNDGVETKVCDAFRAKFAAKMISREMFGLFLKEKGLADIEGNEIGDVDGDGRNDLMKEFDHAADSIFLPSTKNYCAETSWNVVEPQSKHFWFAVELSSTRDFVLIESAATLVRAR